MMMHDEIMVMDIATLRRLACDASVDPRTIAKVMKGERVRGLAYHRARAVLVAAGYRVPAPRHVDGDEGARGGAEQTVDDRRPGRSP